VAAAEPAGEQWDAVRAFALGFPNAIEDLPWGIPVVKVDNGSRWPTVFVGLGHRDAAEPGVYVKLRSSYDQAIDLAGAFPTRMSGVGQFGRLTIPLPVADLDLLFDWVDESYRLIAPKRLVRLLDAAPRTAAAPRRGPR
jgi:hypothetical protein